MFPSRVFIGAGRSDILVFKPNAGCLFEERGSTGVHKYTLKTHPFSQFRTPNELDTESQVIGGACAQRQWHIVVMTAGLRSGLLPSVTATPQPKNVKKTPCDTWTTVSHRSARFLSYNTFLMSNRGTFWRNTQSPPQPVKVMNVPNQWLNVWTSSRKQKLEGFNISVTRFV